MIGLLLALALQAGPPPGLILVHVGRYAVFADASTRSRDGDIAQVRALQLAAPGFTAGGTPFLGGWSWWRIDCEGRTADRLDFAALRADRTEGPATPEAAPARPIAPDGDTAALAALACAAAPAPSPGLTLEQAIALAHRELGEP